MTSGEPIRRRNRPKTPRLAVGWRELAAVAVMVVIALGAVWGVIRWGQAMLARPVALAERVERLERLHEINHELERLREEYRREQAELEAISEPEVRL